MKRFAQRSKRQGTASTLETRSQNETLDQDIEIKQSQQKTYIKNFLREYGRLILYGIGCECFYVFYLLRSFPLIHNENKLLDIGWITNYSHSSFLAFLSYYSIAFLLAWLSWSEIRKHAGPTTLWLIFGFGSLFVITNVFVYPISALDIYGYVSESVELIRYHANPMMIPAAQFPNDPVMKVSEGFVTHPAPYGPIAILFSTIPTLLVGSRLLANLILLKTLYGIVLLIDAYLVYRIVKQIKPELAYTSALALAWNPFALLEYVANGHNDVLMMFFILLALWSALKQHYYLAFLYISLSVFVKYASLPLVPVFILYTLRLLPSKKTRLLYLCICAITAIAITIIVLGPFWEGSKIFSYANTTTNQKYLSFYTLLQDFGIPDLKNHIIDYLIFFVYYGYALLLTQLRSKQGLLLACFWTLFAILAFAASYIQPWYLIWPCMIALLLARQRMYAVVALISYVGAMAELVHAYIMMWGAAHIPDIFNIVSSTGYLLLFGPTVFVLVGCFLNDCFKHMKTWLLQLPEIVDRGLDILMHL